MTRPLAGPLLLGIDALHLLVGVLVHGQALADMAREGVIGTLAPRAGALLLDREAAFWFETAGVGVLLLGGLALWVERRVGVLPASLGWALLAVVALGVSVAPVSGFWAFVAPAGVVLVRARRARTAAA